MTQPASNPGQLAGILMLVAAVAITAAVFTVSWVTASWDEGTYGINLGPLGAEFCDSGEGGQSYGDCRSISWGELKGTRSDVVLTARLSLLGGIASLVCAGIAGVMALTRRGARVPTGIFVGVWSGSAAVMAYFVIRSMGESRGEIDFGPGYSALLGFGGLIMASVVSRAMLAPLRRLGPTAYVAPAQVAGAAPCPRCQAPLQYVAQYQRYYCASCQSYV